MNNNYFGTAYQPTTQFGQQVPVEDEEMDYNQAEVAVPTSMEQPAVPMDKSQFIAPMDENGLQAPVVPADGEAAPDMRTEAEKAAGAAEEQRNKYLSRYEQAKTDASGSLYSRDGYQYQAEVSNTDKWKETLLTGAAALFMVGMPAAGIAAAAMTWMSSNDRQHRRKQVGYLEEKGYKPEDIDAWVTSGDHRLLAEDKASERYLTPGAGKVFDKQTGKWIEGPGGATTGDINYAPYQDANGEWWVKQGVDAQGNQKPPKHLPNYKKGKGTSGGGYQGGDGENTDIFQDKNGQYWQRQFDAKGNAKPPKHLPNYGKTLDAQAPELSRLDTEYGVAWKNSDGRQVDLDDAPDNSMTTDGQRKNASFVRRATNAEKTFRDVTDPSKYDPTEWNSYVSGKSMFPEIAKSDDRRKMEAARREFGNAVLRTDTGAAYSLLEQSDVDKLFPQAGDSKELVEQKRIQREEILAALAQGTGGAQRYAQSHIQKKLYGDKPAPKKDTTPSPTEQRGNEFDQTSKVKPTASAPKAEQKPYAKGKYGDKYVDLRRNTSTGKIEGLRAGSSTWEVAQ